MRSDLAKPSQDKLAGILIGLATGDALGAPHEFKTQARFVYRGYLYLAPEYCFRCGKRVDVIGQYTDDSEETLCILRSVIEQGAYNREAIILKYLEWAKDSKALGKNTRALFKGIKTLSGFQSRWDKMFKNTDPATWTQSNGSLMRCSFLAFLDPTSIIIDCMITNPHPININCNFVYCYMIRYTALDYPKMDIIYTLWHNPLICSEVKQVINQAVSNIQFSRDVKSVGKGWVLHGLYCAIWAWYHFDTYQDPIDTIIKAGGDTDTNAAIVGALIGAKLGYQRLYAEERTRYNINVVRTADFRLGDNPRPPQFCLWDFDQLISSFTALL